MDLVCCFIGHRKIDITESLVIELTKLIETLILSKKVSTFLFGSRSQFNDLCYKVVSDLKVKYTEIKRIFVRGEYQYINKQYKNYLLEFYEDTYFPECLSKANKLSYILRNQVMIDNSDYCIFYYKENYIPHTKTKSGTKLALDYAKKKKKTSYIIH